MKGNKIVLKAAEGITFRCREEDGTLVIEAIHELKKDISEYDYKNPIIPQGFTYLKGEWKKGFTIRNMADGSEFVWVPVGYLEKDGSLNGKNFNQSFGRRNFREEEFSMNAYHEEVDVQMLESVKKYGGCYISAYLASVENDKLVFKKGNMPWTKISQYKAQEVAKNYANENSDFVTCLPSGAVYDSIFKWIIQSEEKTFDEVVNDSTNWGNYRNAENPVRKVTATGSRENWSACNIYDLAGNFAEWSTEKNGSSFVVLRGGSYDYNGDIWPVAKRYYCNPNNEYGDTSFRAVLYIK